MRKRSDLPGRQMMDAAGRRIRVLGLAQKILELVSQRLGLIGTRRNRHQRPFKPEHGLAQHQSSGRALEAHYREATVAPRTDPRLKLAGCLLNPPSPVS